MKSFSRILPVAILALGSILPARALVLSEVVSGSATINYDSSVFAVLTNPNFFDASSNDLTYNQIIDLGTPGDATGWTGLVHDVNGTTLPGGTRSTVQATTFSYDAADLTGTASGAIGLAGITRFAVPSELGGGVVTFGDMRLVYAVASSSWKIQAAFGWGSPFEAFTLSNVSITGLTASGFTLSGDLNVDPLLGGFYQLDSSKPTGTFLIEVTTAAVPEPSTYALLAGAFVGACVVMRRRVRR